MAKKFRDVQINGALVRCEMTESLGYNHDIRGHAAMIMHDGRERLAVRQGGWWRLWEPRERAKPLVEHIEQCRKSGEVLFSGSGVCG